MDHQRKEGRKEGEELHDLPSLPPLSSSLLPLSLSSFPPSLSSLSDFRGFFAGLIALL